MNKYPKTRYAPNKKRLFKFGSLNPGKPKQKEVKKKKKKGTRSRKGKKREVGRFLTAGSRRIFRVGLFPFPATLYTTRAFVENIIARAVGARERSTPNHSLYPSRARKVTRV